MSLLPFAAVKREPRTRAVNVFEIAMRTGTGSVARILENRQLSPAIVGSLANTEENPLNSAVGIIARVLKNNETF